MRLKTSYILLATHQSTDPVYCMVALISLHIEFYELYWRIFSLNPIIRTDSHFDVISCGGRQLYIEPGWWVEGATSASGTTPLSVPQGVTIWPENTIDLTPFTYSCFTKVVLANERVDASTSSASTNTGACCCGERSSFIKTSSESPDVLTGRAMCHADSIHIANVNWPTWTS